MDKNNDKDFGIFEVELNRCPPIGGITSDESFDEQGDFILNLSDVE